MRQRVSFLVLQLPFGVLLNFAGLFLNLAGDLLCLALYLADLSAQAIPLAAFHGSLSVIGLEIR